MEHENRFNALLDRLKEELVSGNRRVDHERQYAKYFEITTNQKCGIKVTPKQNVITQAEKDYGFFALISNDKKTMVFLPL